MPCLKPGGFMPKPENKTMAPMPWWAKLIVGATAVGLIAKFLPLQEILYLFMMIVMIPMALFAGIGLISQGTYEGLQGQIARVQTTLQDKVQEKLRNAA
jgi:hypothetical protein